MQTAKPLLLSMLALCFANVGAQQAGCSGPPSSSTQMATLIASNINGPQGAATITLQMSPAGFMFRVVCLSSSGIRNQYRFVSIVAYYSINGGTSQYGQFEFECFNSMWSVRSLILDQTLYNQQTLIANSPAINAPNRTDCSYCLNSGFASPPRFTDTANHCSACSGCAQPLCYITDTSLSPSGSNFTSVCCNYYMSDGITCTTACPPSSYPDGNRTCVPCSLTCQNGGTLRSDSCACNCTAVSTGSDCSAIGFCSADLNSSSGDRGTYSWPEAAVGQTISQMCQYGVVGQNITRLCNGDLTWTDDASQCPTVVTNQFKQLIQNQDITAQNVINVTAQLQAVVSQSTQMVDQSVSNLAVVTNVIAQISNISSPTAPINTEVIVNVVAVLSSLQTWPPSVLSTNGSVMVEKFEIIATNLVQQQNFTEFQVTQNLTIFIAEKLPLENLAIEGKNYSTEGGGGMANTTTTPASPKLTASVVLPPSLFDSIEYDSNLTDVGIFFSIYKTASFFPLANVSNSTIVAPLVVGVTVVPGITYNLTDPIVLVFTIPNKNYSEYVCVNWNFHAAGGKGNWTTDGCVTYVYQSNLAATIECHCFHLTNFAILVDISSRVQPNQPLNKGVQHALEYISYIGVALSLFGLVLSLAALLLIKKLRKKDVSKYHIQLCCALIGMLLVFVVGIDKTENFGGCVTVSVLIHYFTLVAVMWMGAEALFMFQKLVMVFVQITTRYIIVLSLICWVVPLVPAIIPLSIDRNLLVRRNSSEVYCFINNVTVFFAAFLGPILLVLVFNAVIFVVVIMVLVKHVMKRSKKQTNTIQLMAKITGISSLLGLTWVFGALTIMKADQAFQIVFTIANSLQGFFIFIFFCVLNNDVRSVWLQYLLGKYHKAKPCSTEKIMKPQPTLESSDSKHPEPVDTEEYIHIGNLGSPIRLIRTYTHKGHHMEEKVELTFVDRDESGDGTKPPSTEVSVHVA